MDNSDKKKLSLALKEIVLFVVDKIYIERQLPPYADVCRMGFKLNIYIPELNYILQWIMRKQWCKLRYKYCNLPRSSEIINYTDNSLPRTRICRSLFELYYIACKKDFNRYVIKMKKQREE